MADFIVLNTNDNGTGSLRDAIDKANSQTGADRIVFDSNFFNTAKTIRLTTQLIINDSVAIEGLGQNLITISGDANNNGVNDNGDTRLFFVNQGDVSFNNFTFSGGRGKGGNGGNGGEFNGGGGGGLGAGGALFINNGTAYVGNVIFSNNQAVGGDGGKNTGTGFGGGGGFGGDGGNGGSNFSGGGGGGFIGTGADANANGGGGGGGSTGDGIGNNGGSGNADVFGGSAAGSGSVGIGGGVGGGGGGSNNTGIFGGNGGVGGGGGGGQGIGGNGANGGNGGDFGGGGGVWVSGQPGSGAGGWGGGGGGHYRGRGGFGGGGASNGSGGQFGGFAGTGTSTGGGAGLGGAIFIRNGSLNMVDSTFDSNSTAGGSAFGNGQNGEGKGGAIFVNTGVTAAASGLAFTNNDASNQVTVGQTGIGTSLDTDAVYGTVQVLDTTPPAAPTVTSPASTNVTTPVIAGNAETNSNVTLSIDNSGSITTYTASANASGVWSIDLATATPATGTTPTLSNGSSVNLSVSAKDAAGNTSAAVSQTLVIDTTPPTAPTVTSPASTNVTTPVIAGNAETNSNVTLSIDNSGSITTYTVSANASGVWSIDLATATPATGTTPTLSNGSSVNLSVSAKDAAGNTSAAVSQTLVIDTTPPTAPTVTSPASTNVTTPVIAGNAETNSNVTLSIDNSGSITTYTVSANASGVWSIDLATATPATGTTPTLSDGSSVNLSVSAKDAAGNTSAAVTQTLVIDTTPPTAPTVTSPASTNVTTPVIAGNAEANSSVTLSIDNSGSITTYTVNANASGVWSIDLATATPATGTTPTLSDGSSVNLSVSAKDAAGNTSAAVTQTLVIDTTPPTAPTVTSPASTNVTTPVIAGNAETNSNVTLSIDNSGSITTYTVSANASGVWSIDLATATPATGTTPTLSNGSSANLSVSAKDAAGNTSAAVSQTLKIDTTPANAPTLSPNNPDDSQNLKPQLSLTTQNSSILSLTQNDSNILFNLASFGSENKSTNEVSVFTVDDDLGTIDGISPNSPGYTEAAFKRAKTIFSSIFNSPQGFDSNPSSILNFEEGQKLGFYVISDSSTDTVKSELATMGKTSQRIFFSTTNQIKISQTQEGSFNLNWQDKDSLAVSIRTTNEALPKGTQLQMEAQQELIDLRTEADKVSTSFTMYREAMYNNTIGFYKVADADGTIVDSLTGERITATAQNRVRYAEVALRNRVQSLDMSVANQSTQVFQNDIMGGEIYAPFIIADGNSNNIESNFDNVYFSYIGVNSDKTDHIRLLGNNVFGFEDLLSGGDKDFNDVIVKMNIE